MEPKWRDMCQIELSARTNRGWDGGGGETPLTISRNLACEPLPRPWGRHLDCFRSEHALLKIHKKGCGGSAGYPPSSSSDVRIYACASRLCQAPNLSGTSQPPGVYCAFQAQLFMCPLSPTAIHRVFLSYTHPDWGAPAGSWDGGEHGVPEGDGATTVLRPLHSRLILHLILYKFIWSA